MPTPFPKLVCVVGARPNFVKIAPLLSKLSDSHAPLKITLVHTGQHYDTALNKAIIDTVDLQVPDFCLSVGSGTQSVQTAKIMMKFEAVLDQVEPTAILVVGDVNSTVACSLTAAKKNIPVIHVEAGLRSFDREMPEEINRVMTDHLSSLLFTTEMSANNNLKREGIDPNNIHFVGNIMIDTLNKFKDKAIEIGHTLSKYQAKRLKLRQYALLTLHRPSNVDCRDKLLKLVESLEKISANLDIVFPVHPRTLQSLTKFDLLSRIQSFSFTTPPLDYLEMLGAMQGAQIILTDSGGLQEEATVLQKPCITLRENTERPVTVSEGTNRLIGQQYEKLAEVVSVALKSPIPSMLPTYWDGNTASRIAEILVPWLYQRGGNSIKQTEKVLQESL